MGFRLFFRVTPSFIVGSVLGCATSGGGNAIRVKLSAIRLVPKHQLGNGIARKVGQASSPDILMTSGVDCPTYCFKLQMNSSEKMKQGFWNRRIPKLELENERKQPTHH